MFLKCFIELKFLGLPLMTKCFGQEKMPGCLRGVIRQLELVSEPSVLARKSVAFPTVSGSVTFGNPFI